MSNVVERQETGKSDEPDSEGSTNLATEQSPQSIAEEKNDYQLSQSEIFEILSAERRQEVLRYLDDNNGTATLGELAEHIASIECDCETTQLSSQQRKRAYVGLYQCHLPKMADAHVIEYDSDRGTVALNEQSRRLLEYLYFEETDSERTYRNILHQLFH